MAGKAQLLAVLVAFVVVQVALCLHCDPEIDCSQAPIPACVPVDVQACEALGGHLDPNGGYCGYCDKCSKEVGAGQLCNNYEDVTGKCAKGLVCSHRSDGVCVKPQDCEYPAST